MLWSAWRWYNYCDGGSAWAWWPAYLSFWDRVCNLGLPEFERLRHYEAAAIHGSYRFMHKKFWIVCDRPTVIGRDEQNRAHCDTGPQLAWADGYALYHIHGVRVTKQIVEAPETLTADQIRNETNAEVRRVMLSRFGEARYLDEIGAELIHEDEFGKLYRAEIPNDEPLVMVRVMNSTPEPDGSIKPYTLRVDPRCTTAQDAVASTWRYSDTGVRVFPSAADYRPAVET